MRVIVVGLGVQGHKRREFAGEDFIASVDPVNLSADYKNCEDVPLSAYDAALLCVPDEPKVELITYFLDQGKHVLVEKPLWAPNEQTLLTLEKLAHSKGVVCYTAYNHRFEPHFIKMKELIRSGMLGEIYHCRLFYGNGTARVVRGSPWRDKGSGVLPDLGSHLLDTANDWFGILDANFSLISSRCFENRAPDHVIFKSLAIKPQFEMETTLLSWKNHFSCDILAEKGSAHISSLCKWGPATFSHRTRVFPSGRPKEESITLVQEDPTWAAEYKHFKYLCENNIQTDLSSDRWLNQTLRTLSKVVLEEMA